MLKFSEVYAFGRDQLVDKCFEKWNSTYQASLLALFAEAGPDPTQAEILDKMHIILGTPGAPPNRLPPAPWEQGPRHKPPPPRKVSPEEHADDLIGIAKESLVGPGDKINMRCGLLKMLKHFYFMSNAGNQSIWVVDNPVSYHKWTFDLFDGKSEHAIKDALTQNSEIFGSGSRQLFADAFNLARKWSMDAAAKLAKPDAKTVELVQRWFGVAASDNLDSVVQWIAMSFGWISQACNATTVIFADSPPDRAAHRTDDAGTYYGKDEAMLVIYIYKAFLKYGKKDHAGTTPQLWFAALTVIHELAHKQVSTEDKRYGDDGIKPGKTLKPEDAIWNADSYAYFATDLAGALPAAEFKQVYR
jgi:hypothetical protein